MTIPPGTDKAAQERGRPDIEGDIRRLWDVIKNGGIAIVPNNLGYGIWGGSADATRRVIEAKHRGAHKRQGMVGGNVIQPDLHILNQRQWDIINCVTKDYDLPLAVIAKYRPDHPLMRDLDPYLRSIGTARGTIAQLLNPGSKFQDPIGRLSLEHLVPIFGSSANLTGKGIKYRVEDIEPEIIEVADIVLDYGLCRYHSYGISSTQINFETMEVTRIGTCYELISDILKRHFNWELPPDPGREVNRHGHLQEFALAGLVE